MYMGATAGSLWVLAHECGHGGFCPSKTVNDIVGFILHSFLLTPYFAWQTTHATHHARTNHMSEGETWVPSKGNHTKGKTQFWRGHLGTSIRLFLIYTFGWYAYLTINVTGSFKNRGVSHWNPASPLFKPKERMKIIASNIGVLAMFSFLCYLGSIYGFKAIVF